MITVYEKEQRTLIMKGAPDVLIEKAAVDPSVERAVERHQSYTSFQWTTSDCGGTNQ